MPKWTLSRFLVGAATTVALFALPLTTAFAQDMRDFAISNESSDVMMSAWIAPSAASEWGHQVLSAPIGPGEVRQFVFPYPQPGVCVYDLHIEYFIDNRPDKLEGVNICTVATIRVTDTTITYE